ncbi:MAG: zf-HC2 domain-containing protein [Lachnospiraceae bacterium]|nr:zf-HC2 domain-containing protein [Lachnospiraceae bacterium]MBQ8846279.1 zf-HC2 domain-containing protein [Lachnospiraceae bacterium]
MKNECSIVRDLLPLYVENMVSAETGEFVKEHLEGCGECREEYERMKEPQVREESRDAKGNREAAAPLVALQRKLGRKKVQTVLCTVLFVVALLVSAFSVLSAPVYIPYDEELFTITENEDESVTIVFDERVTDYECSSDAHIGWVGVEPCYEIKAWSTLWNKWIFKKDQQFVVIHKVTGEDFSVYYASNDGSENVCVYGEPVTDGGVVTLPRLTLNYYFLIAAVGVVVLLAIWWIVRKKAIVKVWVERALFYPISYCVAHVIVEGFGSSTYSAGRDFMLIIFLSIVIYGGVLLARSIYRERKEIKALTERNE